MCYLVISPDAFYPKLHEFIKEQVGVRLGVQIRFQDWGGGGGGDTKVFCFFCPYATHTLPAYHSKSIHAQGIIYCAYLSCLFVLNSRQRVSLLT